MLRIQLKKQEEWNDKTVPGISPDSETAQSKTSEPSTLKSRESQYSVMTLGLNVLEHHQQRRAAKADSLLGSHLTSWHFEDSFTRGKEETLTDL